MSVIAMQTNMVASSAPALVAIIHSYGTLVEREHGICCEDRIDTSW